MKFRCLWMVCCLCVALQTMAQLKNSKLDDLGTESQTSEPAIVINPRDTKNIVASTSGNRVFYTIDGGVTWNKSQITSSVGIRGSISLVVSDKGDFYFFRLSGKQNEQGNGTIICHQSKDGGKTWDEGVVIGNNPPKDQQRPWATIDEKGNLFAAWSQLDAGDNQDPNCLSAIQLSSSSNGKKWSKPIEISQTPGNCAGGDKTVMGAFPTTSHDGKVFVSWASQGKLFLDRSFDGGTTWLRNDIAITTQSGGWDQKIDGHQRSNGLPILQIDRAKLSPARGAMFLAWADQRNGEQDTDIWFLRSVNFGDYWTTPLRVNDDELGSHQYAPWMTVDQTTGYIYIVYYDRRDYDGNQTDVYLAYSIDSGNKFKNVKISETPFTPDGASINNINTNISAHKGQISMIWSRIDNGVVSVWTCLVKLDELEKIKK